MLTNIDNLDTNNLDTNNLDINNLDTNNDILNNVSSNIYVDLRDLERKNTQMFYIATIFENNIDKEIQQSEIGKQYSEMWFKEKGKFPGDIQRQIRTYYDKRKLYGIEQIKYGLYRYKPILKKINNDVLNNVSLNNISLNNNVLTNDVSNNSRNFANSIKLQVLERSKNKCEICNQPFNPQFNQTLNQDREYDHWIPYSKGGLSTLENCVILCRNCNLKKKDHTPFYIVWKHIRNIYKIEKNCNKNYKFQNQIMYQTENINMLSIIISFLINYTLSIVPNKKEWFLNFIIKPFRNNLDLNDLNFNDMN